MTFRLEHDLNHKLAHECSASNWRLTGKKKKRKKERRGPDGEKRQKYLPHVHRLPALPGRPRCSHSGAKIEIFIFNKMLIYFDVPEPAAAAPENIHG